MLMNKNSDRASGEAKLHYGPNGFRVLRAGQHVFCASSGVPIALDELRYWSVEFQEPYATPQLATERLKP
ncbi:DUF2093 domain-containing protein [Qipengyuania psychrotolerans]|uniref:DUF2093 domain-containing protein n=1 Tax=Qipengyuania psychrotolerans TaxID=2867238 RepID=A0ABX8ZM18_9SPHN|nr:DUF2093 domain-containing protein [Qipengyuania psychrotolerans]QZD88582.1 DUF2093 domain-containing protein [Qipengyuania psychrotolerans]